MDKDSIRREIRIRKRQYSPDVLRTLSQNITDKIEKHPWFTKAQCILLYHSLPDEVYTHEIIEKYKSLKKLLLPTVVGDELELHVYATDSVVRQGKFNISESEGNLFEDYPMIDLAIIPGVAFDTKGNRIGRGKGYYDRLLPQIHCPKLGICFQFQIVDEIPSDRHDIPVDEVLF